MTHYHRPSSTITLIMLDSLMEKVHAMYIQVFISEEEQHYKWLEDAYERGVFNEDHERLFAMLERYRIMAENNEQEIPVLIQPPSPEPWLPDQELFICEESLNWDDDLCPTTEEIESSDDEEPARVNGTEEIELSDLFFDLDHLMRIE